MKNPVSIHPMPVYQAIAIALDAYCRCVDNGNAEWEAKHHDSIVELCYNALPSGSGIDKGTTFDFDASTPNKLVFNLSYHHMNDGGYYDGWTDHRVIVMPSLVFGLDIRITGPNRNDVKDYLYECYQTALSEVLEANPRENEIAS